MAYNETTKLIVGMMKHHLGNAGINGNIKSTLVRVMNIEPASDYDNDVTFPPMVAPGMAPPIEEP